MVYYGGALTKIIDRQDKIACAPGCKHLGQRVNFYVGLIINAAWAGIKLGSHIAI